LKDAGAVIESRRPVCRRGVIAGLLKRIDGQYGNNYVGVQ
jgi:hypothetical protein